MESKTLIVVGMHRSGTSLITNWLSRCGLQVGELLLEAGPSNLDGHFEDVEFLRIHEEILTSNNLPASGLVDADKINISIYQKEKLKTIIKIKNKLYKQWSWKEPRTCLFLNTYRELLPKSKYLVIVRDYQSVINSLLKRDFAEIERKYMSRKVLSRHVWKYFRKSRMKQKFYRNNAERYLKVWISYNEHILNMLKDLPEEDYIVINYSLLEKSDRKVFSSLTEAWGFALRYFSFSEVYKENLMSRAPDLAPFLTNTGLVTRAKVVENDFEKYLSFY